MYPLPKFPKYLEPLDDKQLEDIMTRCVAIANRAWGPVSANSKEAISYLAIELFRFRIKDLGK
jgi:hypothetical protein